jgi:hypothetical protein
MAIPLILTTYGRGYLHRISGERMDVSTTELFPDEAFLQDAATGRPWAQEVSGSLLSLIKNLRTECETFCSALAGAEFHGIMFQSIENLRTNGDGYPRHTFFPTDVCYTPIEPQNRAHADLVTHTKTDDSAKEVRDWLQDMIQAVKPDKLNAVCSMRQAPNFPKS